MKGHPRWTCHSGEFWQNMVHWRREWQTSPVFLLGISPWTEELGRATVYGLAKSQTWPSDFTFFISFFTPWKKRYDKAKQCIKKQRHYFVYKSPSSQSYGFSSSHVWMWELDHKESWALKNWCFWTVVLEKMVESPLDCKEIKTANPKGNQPWIFTEKTHAKAPILGPPDVKTWLRKDLMLGKIEGRRRRGWQRMAPLTRWTWFWVNSGSWWWTGRPGVLRFMVSQRVGHDWATELNWSL